MKPWTKTPLVALFLTAVSVSAKPNISDLAHKCNSLGKKAACRELAKIAAQDKDNRVRMNAVENLADQPTLAEIVVENKDLLVSAAALAKLTDQSLLAKIALEAKHFTLRMTAVSKLVGQSVLAKIAVNDESVQVRGLAVVKVTDQSVLAKIAAEDKDSKVRLAAVAKVTDQSLLAQIAVEDKKRGEVRAVVISYLGTADFAAAKNSGWSLFGPDTILTDETINAETGKATIVAQVAFKGGTGIGVQFNSGAIARFGASVGPSSPLPLYGASSSVYPANGSTYLRVSQTFFLVLENGAWKISGMTPSVLVVDPPFRPL